MEPLSVAPGHPEQARNGVFGHVDEPSGGPSPTAFVQMIDDRFRLFLRDFGVAQGRPTSFGKLLAARPATQEPDAVLAVDFAHGEIVLTRETKPLAVGVDTR